MIPPSLQAYDSAWWYLTAALSPPDDCLMAILHGCRESRPQPSHRPNTDSTIYTNIPAELNRHIVWAWGNNINKAQWKSKDMLCVLNRRLSFKLTNLSMISFRFDRKKSIYPALMDRMAGCLRTALVLLSYSIAFQTLPKRWCPVRIV